MKTQTEIMDMKRWIYRSYSSYKQPRSIVNRTILIAGSRKEAIERGKEQFNDYGRYCTAVPAK